MIKRISLAVSLCFGCADGCKKDPEDPRDELLELETNHVVALVGQPFDVQYQVRWERREGGISLRAGRADPPATDLTGEFMLSGSSGFANESHRFECVEAGLDAELIGSFDSMDNLVQQDLLNIVCTAPVADQQGDQFYSDPTESPGQTPDYSDIVAAGAGIIEVGEDAADAINAPRDPFDAPQFFHVTQPDFAGVSPGEYVATITQVAEDIPLSNEQFDQFFSVVFETDGRSQNDWLAQGDFSYDQFQGADTFYQAIWDSSTMGWSLLRTIVGDDQSQSSAATDAIFTIRGTNATWLIPREELGPGELFYRVATFVTVDESFAPSDSGGDVNLESPMLPLLPVPVL